MQKTRYLLLISIFFLFSGIETLYSQSDIWVGSWSCAPYAAGPGNTPPSPYLENNTLRQVIRVSIGGDTLRVKFSNKTCSTPVTMETVTIAVSTGGSSVDASTLKQLEFDRNTSVTMDPYSSVTSDPIAYPLNPNARMAITIHYGQTASTVDMTSHVASRTDSYILEGDHATSAEFGGSSVTAHWFHINTIDVLAPDTAGCIGVLGNSITDGYGLSGGLQNRWTDIFSERLLDDPRTEKTGVLNLGIGGTRVAGSNPTSGISRFQDDILNQSGLRWVIIFHGTNDIAAGASATTIIDAYKAMISDAHERNIKVYGTTITPFKGHSHYSEAHENVRKTVNEWIRTPGNFDACIDFDQAIRDPENPEKMMAEYTNDWLHPNTEGYAFLGKSVDMDLFTEIENTQTVFADAGSGQTVIDYGNKGNHSVTLNGTGSSAFGGNIHSYAWSEGNNQIATGKNPSVTLPLGSHTITLSVTDGNGNVDTDIVTINVVEDSGVWLEAECGEVGSLWQKEPDSDASGDKYVTIHPGNNNLDNAPVDAAGLLTYTFEVKESGTYELYSRLICPSPNDDSFWIKMNNGSFALWNGINAATWQWFDFPSSFELSKGKHKLTIGYREDGAKLDKIWITDKVAELPDKGGAADNCGTAAFSLQNDSDVNIFPNPMSDTCTISLPMPDADISIYNSQGSLIKKRKSTGREITLNTTNLASGIYLVEIKSSNQVLLKKIIKE